MSRSDVEVRPPPALPEDAHKGDAGRVLCVCGSATMPGAAILVVRAACRAGAGLVSIGCLSSNLLALVPGAAPEALLVDLTEWRALLSGTSHEGLAGRRDDARVVGPGLGRGELTRRVVERLALGAPADAAPAPTVLDADALNELAAGPGLAALRDAPAPIVLTPHPGEAGRLLGRDVPGADAERAARLDAARELARGSGAVVVLKGRCTLVVAPDGERVFVNETGNAGMATGGAGDVLSGILGAYLAARPAEGDDAWTPFDAAVAAVHVHGLAGDLAARELGRRAVIASDLIAYLPAAQRALTASGDAAR